MPIMKFVEGASFSPEEIKDITVAFEEACKTLGLTDRTNPLFEIVAVTIIDVAKGGARGAEQIQQRALNIINSDRKAAARPPAA